jgi:hypothetical protein
MPVSSNSTSGTVPTFTITVNGTGPEWFYCSQGKHCQSGMVFAINPTEAKTLAGYKANCANATANITPGQSEPVSAPPSQSGEVSPTDVSAPTVAATPPSTQTGLPVQVGSLASTTVSRNTGWLVAGLVGVLSIAMML